MAGPAEVKNLLHAVAKGETLKDIASAYNIAVDRLRAANPAGLAGVADDKPIDRLLCRALEVPRLDRGTTLMTGLATEQTHELEVPHRFAVLYAADRSDLTGLFDVVRPDGEVVRDVLYARFDIRYVVPAGVDKIVFAAGIVTAAENPLENYEKRAGYCAEKPADLHGLKRYAGAGGDPATKAALEGEFRRSGAIFLASGEIPVRTGCEQKAVRIAIAEEEARTEQHAGGMTFVVPWKKVPLGDLDPKKRYRFYLLASNGKTAVDGAASGDIHLVRVTLEVETPEPLPGLPKEAAFEARIAPFEMTAPELARRLEDAAIHYCTDSVPLRRPANYKDTLAPFVVKAYEREEAYDHKAAKVGNDVADHRLFRVAKETNRVDVPANELLLLLPQAKGLLDRVVKDDRPGEGYDLAAIDAFYPLATDLARIRVFTRTVDPRENEGRAAVDAAMKVVEEKMKAVQAAEADVRAARAEKLAGEATERARRAVLVALHARRAALEKRFADARMKAGSGKLAAGELEAALFERDRAREELRVLFAEKKDDLRAAEEMAAAENEPECAASEGAGHDGGSSRGATRPPRSPTVSAAPGDKDKDKDKAKAPKKEEDRAEKAALALGRTRGELVAAEKMLGGKARTDVRELVPFGAAGDAIEAVGRGVEAGASSVVALLADDFESVVSLRVDLEEVLARSAADPKKTEKVRRIPETADATFVPPPPPPKGAAGFARIEKRVVAARWTDVAGRPKTHARPDETVRLVADLAGFVPGLKATFRIYEKDETSPDDFIEEVKGETGAGEVAARWCCKYVEDTDDAVSEKEKKQGFTEPEFYFTVKVEDETVKQAAAREARSALLLYQDWIEVEVVDAHGRPLAGRTCVVAVGTKKLTAVLDEAGRARLEGIPPGRCSIEVT